MPELNLNDLNTAPELTLDAPAAPSLTLDLSLGTVKVR